MTSNQRGSYALGDTRATIPATKRRKTVRWSKSQKSEASSDRGLQFALVKPDSLVTVDQPRYGEYVLRFCTKLKGARQLLKQDGENPSL